MLLVRRQYKSYPSPQIISLQRHDDEDDEEIFVVTKDDDITLTEYEIGNLTQDTSSEEECGAEWIEANLEALQEATPSLQDSASIMHIQLCDQLDTDFPVKIWGIDVIALHDTGNNMRCMSYVCYVKLRDPPSLKTIPVISVHSATGCNYVP